MDFWVPIIYVCIFVYVYIYIYISVSLSQTAFGRSSRLESRQTRSAICLSTAHVSAKSVEKCHSKTSRPPGKAMQPHRLPSERTTCGPPGCSPQQCARQESRQTRIATCLSASLHMSEAVCWDLLKRGANKNMEMLSPHLCLASCPHDTLS